MDQDLRTATGRTAKWSLATLCGALTLALMVLLLRWPQRGISASEHLGPRSNPTSNQPTVLDFESRARRFQAAGPAPSALQDTAVSIVKDKLARFVQSRREILQGYAAHKGVNVPAELAAFLDIVESGDWDGIDRTFTELLAIKQAGDVPESFQILWPVIFETLGVAEAVHSWPAQALLDYGNFILSSVPAGGVYMGGTDEGRFIPTLLNATSEEPRVILTQTALADARYLEYERFRNGQQLVLPTQAQVDEAFAAVVASHGRPTPSGSRIVEGQEAVMAINTRLVELMAKSNPDRSFAIQESFPMKDTYAGANTQGPLYVLGDPSANPRPGDPREVVSFWQSAANRLTAESDSLPTEEIRRAYAKLVTGQANLLMAQGHDVEAEQALRISMQFSPALPDAVFPLVEMLHGSGRTREAIALLDQSLDHAIRNPSTRGDATSGYRQLREQLAAGNP